MCCDDFLFDSKPTFLFSKVLIFSRGDSAFNAMNAAYEFNRSQKAP